MSDCTFHTGYIGKNGYGQKKYRGKVVAAHRLAYALDAGLDVFMMGGSVLHSCDNPLCVNPKHLRLGTHTQNMQDRAERDRTSHALSLDEAEYIRNNFIRGTRWNPGNTNELAKKFSVHRQSIMNVVNGVSRVGSTK